MANLMPSFNLIFRQKRKLLISFLFILLSDFEKYNVGNAFSIQSLSSPRSAKRQNNSHSRTIKSNAFVQNKDLNFCTGFLRSQISQRSHTKTETKHSLFSNQSHSKITTHNMSLSSQSSQDLSNTKHFKYKYLVAIPIILFLSLCKKLITIHSKNLFEDTSYMLSIIFFLSGFGITLERNTTIGKALSAPLATMSLALIIANLGFAPFSSPIYTMVNRNLVPLAVPMLLFDSDIRRVFSDTGTLLIAFFVGAFSTIVGTITAFPFIPLTSLGNNEGWKIASALAARHIGGAVNFVSVAETLDVSGTSITAAIAADNIVVALYFAFLFSISKSGMEQSELQSSLLSSGTMKMTNSMNPVDAEDLSSDSNGTSNITLSTLCSSITVSSILVHVGGILTKSFLPSRTSSLPMISILTVSCATLFPTYFQHLRSTGTAIGILFMQMFFAASGLAGSIALVLQKAPSLFLFSTLQIFIHFITLMGIGKFLCRLPSKELYLASNANVGGPTTAAAMAQAKEWSRLILPALLVGILGYATATPIALALGTLLQRLPLIAVTR